jgi:hypothetical protein
MRLTKRVKFKEKVNALIVANNVIGDEIGHLVPVDIIEVNPPAAFNFGNFKLDLSLTPKVEDNIVSFNVNKLLGNDELFNLPVVKINNKQINSLESNIAESKTLIFA